QFTKANKTGILVLTESHLNVARHTRIQTLFGRRLEVLFSEDPVTPNAKGVAFVINKDLLDTDNMRTWEIVPGRAMLLEIETHKGEKLAILGVYAPNAPSDNAEFWEVIYDFLDDHPTAPRPDMMLGDTNIVEEAIDRLPAHTDPQNVTAALDKLLEKLRLVDGWRRTFPDTRAYTYFQLRHAAGGAQSRIDRIYIRRDKYVQAYDWKISTVGISTDHRMVSVRITQQSAPSTGPGRWVWPIHISKDKELKDFIFDRGTKAFTAAERASQWPTYDATNCALTIWTDFQAAIRDKARARSKVLIPKADREIACLEEEM
ncbi:Endonuclease/exonuclease/phosphatase, partial [Mycena epipterygia]